jgi:hypothetical protein
VYAIDEKIKYVNPYPCPWSYIYPDFGPRIGLKRQQPDRHSLCAES